ncbi:HlyD family type I secretion periplasmic adaptor subunit [Vibrio anguillarum]|uniref:Membrane fusion protein (MFP) family protein n=1 Tax=Vibrio anguillarum TaxID=55601 RepID=A0ABR9Z002_VIBAN|nr:HlyD family type I secretion periplasmic adaptor subunit [Vibrio anguillarum]MBF4243609.1 HlyD family type I secretion periplasmic adaptor subunit [Vibrio anguillarum]MBF4371789.1 HlyD family type I secretion periplasmic adaptor subunit [Vibrio anguillarum]
MISQLKKLRSKRPKTNGYFEFLPGHLALQQSPPSPFARITAITLSLGLLLTLLWTYWGKLDIQATANGRLLVPGRSQVIQSYEQSRVAQIHIADGERVEKGMPLLTLDTLGVSQDIERLRHQIRYQTHEFLKYQALRGKADLAQHPLYLALAPSAQQEVIDSFDTEKNEFTSVLENLRAEMQVNLASQSSLEVDIRGLKQLVSNITQRLDAQKKLKQQRLIGQVQYLEQEKELLESERALAQQTSQQHVLQKQYLNLEERLKALRAQKAREWQDKSQQAHLQLSALQHELDKVREHEGLQVVRSPVTGTVQQLSVHTLGAVLQPAQNLMIIVPDDSVQVAEVKILNKDIGFIYAGQPVTLKIDAFPYTRYGTLSATLVHVSRDSTMDEQLGLVFPAQVQLLNHTIEVDGASVALLPGMSVVAEIKTDQRRIIDYLLSPIREYQAEALREK